MLKKYFLLISLATFCCFSCNSDSTATNSDDHDYSEATLNIGSVNVLVSTSPKTGEFAWANRKDRLVDAMKDNDFDICALAEFDTVIRDYLNANVQTRRYLWWRVGDADKNVNNLAIVYDVDRLTASDKTYFWLSPTPDVASHGWGETDYWRTVMMAKFTDKKTGKKFIFAAGHLPLDDEARDSSAAIILSKIKAYNTEDLPVIFAGDMNGEETDYYHVELCSEYFKDVFNTMPSSRKSGPAGTFNNKSTLTNMETARRIDHIYIHDKGSFKLVSYLCNDKMYGDPLCYPSDHLPLKLIVK